MKVSLRSQSQKDITILRGPMTKDVQRLQDLLLALLAAIADLQLGYIMTETEQKLIVGKWIKSEKDIVQRLAELYMWRDVAEGRKEATHEEIMEFVTKKNYEPSRLKG